MKKIECEKHGAPITRRDFISRGLVAGTGFVVAPTLAHLLIREARAEDPVTHVPFIVFDLAGGAALPANFLVGNKGGPEDLLGNYDLLGWNPKADNIDKRFGLPMADRNISKMMDGILSVLTPEAQANFRMGSLLHTGIIDSSQNPLSALTLVANSGVIGQLLPRSLGSRASFSGGNSKAAIENADLRPLYISQLDDLTKSMGLYRTFSDFKPETIGAIASQLRRLSVAQLTRVVSGYGSAELIQNFDKKHQIVEDTLSKTPDLDPRKDPIFQQLYGLNQNSDPKSATVIRAGIARSVLKRLSGPGAITIDGCDYHDNSQTTGDNKDREIGLEIGRVIEAAHKIGTPVFIQIITDGGIYPATGTRTWAGDSTETSMSVMGYYNPKGATRYKDNKMQLGNYTSAQGADRSSLIGDSTLFAAYSVFANYLQIEGRVGQFMDLAKNVFTKDQLDSVLLFEG